MTKECVNTEYFRGLVVLDELYLLVEWLHKVVVIYKNEVQAMFDTLRNF